MKIGRNDLCPCGTGKKYKHCCVGKVDWNKIYNQEIDPVPFFSTRGRNLYFFDKIIEILELNNIETFDPVDFKKRFTEQAVKQIHEAIVEIWPRNLDIIGQLKRSSDEVSGLYIGDYDRLYLERGIVRHSVYANKIIIVDPFIYPYSVNDQFNPILEPSQYRAQTLKCVNTWISIMPWIEEGLVEIIRTPTDFFPDLKRISLIRQQKKFNDDPELKEALQVSIDEISERHSDSFAFRNLLLSLPDSAIIEKLKEAEIDFGDFSEEEMLKHVQNLRDQDPDFLEPFDAKSNSTQLEIKSSGASYDIAQLTASLTKSYLVTDIYSRWREIELDREHNNVQSKVWSPLAKAFQESELKFLNNINLNHALRLRKEGRLESLRTFLLKVWKDARTENEFDEKNVLLYSEELRDEVRKADDEWNKINQNLLKQTGVELTAGLLASGPLITAGHGSFIAAAAVTAAAGTLANSYIQRKRFPDRFPAAFFMNLKN